MNILTAISDENLFRPFFGEDLTSWRPWSIALRCLYGLRVKSQPGTELVLKCTGRDAATLPENGFSTACFLTGRRSGKSRVAAVIGAFEAAFAGHEKKLAKGEVGVVAIVSPSRYQSGIVWKYLLGAFGTPLLEPEVAGVQESMQTMVLKNGIQIRVVVGDPRTTRGFTLVCVVVDEVCFFGLTEESKVRSDTELVRALRPGLATTGGKLIAISSKYSRKGWAYGQWLRQHGSNQGVSPSFVPNWTTLVWDAPSKVMNPTLSEEAIKRAYEEDPAAARSEFGGEWRDDVAEFVSRSLVEALVVRGRKELLPKPELSYFAFSDLSGGRHDDAALAVAHKEGRKIILDLVKRWKTPFNPYSVVGEQVAEVKRFGLRSVTGDSYSAEFVASAFRAQGVHYMTSALNKSELYRNLLPVLCSGEIELLDNEVMIDQIAGLERRTRSGGQDIVDHPPGGKDDVANVVAGVAASKGKRVVGLY